MDSVDEDGKLYLDQTRFDATQNTRSFPVRAVAENRPENKGIETVNVSTSR
jgi:hypothetical protein